MRLLNYLIIIAFLLYTPIILAAKPVVITGLLKNMVIIQEDGKQHTLRVGDSTPKGVKLIKSDSTEAWLEIDGEVKSYKLGNATAIRIQDPAEEEVLLSPDDNGLYQIEGSINNKKFLFTVDTGATHVAMSARHALQLGLKYRQSGIPTWVETAAGKKRAYRVQLKNVKVRDIVVRDITALVIEGNYPSTILLGMTFLKSLEISHRGRLLLLRQKY